MRGTPVFVVLAGIGGALLPSQAIGGPVTQPPLIIRVYDSAGLAPDRLATAQHAVLAVLKPAGIDITWRDCRRPHPNAPDLSCNGPLEVSEVIVRIVHAGSTQGDDRLGYSSVDVQHHADCLATVFADRIEAMAGRTQSDPGTLLGHVMAHEVGHLLMGTSRHSPAGLMRERWSDNEVRRRSPIDWQLTRTDAKDVRVGLLERSKRLGQSTASNASATATADGDLFEGWTLRSVAATSWTRPNRPHRCAENDDLGRQRTVSLARYLQLRITLLVRYVQHLFTQPVLFRRQQPGVEDSIQLPRSPDLRHQCSHRTFV